MSSDSSYFSSLAAIAPLDEYDEEEFSSYLDQEIASASDFQGIDPSEPDNAPLDEYDLEESLRHFRLLLGSRAIEGTDWLELDGPTNILNEYDEAGANAPLDEYDEFLNHLDQHIASASDFGGSDPSVPENAPPLDGYDEEDIRYYRTAVEGTDHPLELDSPTNILNEYDEKFTLSQDIESYMKNIILLDDDELCSICLQDIKKICLQDIKKICLQDINVGDNHHAGVLKCSHIFHLKCMSEWLNRKFSCPLCRHDVRIDRQPNLKRKRRLSHEAQELKEETNSTHRQRKA